MTVNLLLLTPYVQPHTAQQHLSQKWAIYTMVVQYNYSGAEKFLLLSDCIIHMLVRILVKRKLLCCQLYKSLAHTIYTVY